MKSWLVSVIGLLQLIASSPATLGADWSSPRCQTCGGVMPSCC